MASKRVELKDPAFAAVLAFLVPGLGHFYQRRFFKGALYCICILGTFFTGLNIGHGQVVYFQWKQPDNRTYAYLAQFWVGLPALPALAQANLRSKDSFVPNFVPEEFSAPYSGAVYNSNKEQIGTVEGKIRVEPGSSENDAGFEHWMATFTGQYKTAENTRDIVAEISHSDNMHSGYLDREVAPWPIRRIEGSFREKGNSRSLGRVVGGVHRGLLDRLEAPLQDTSTRSGEPASISNDLDRSHRELGSRFELGVLYTIIAGLLNVLAIFDAHGGPAYEDEELPTAENDPSDKKSPAMA